MPGKRKSFLLHIDSLDVLDDLSNDQAGQLFNAIKSFQQGEDIELEGIIKIAFSPFKNQFMRDAEKYENTCAARALAGAKGGKQKVANASKPKQKVANLADSDSKSKNKSDSDSDSDSLNDLRDSLSGKPDVTNVINHFNLITGQKLKPSAKSHSENISARLSEGHSVDDLKLVIDSKFKEWVNDPKMAQYIRPSTLFQVGKFNGYLQQAKANPVKKSSLHDLSEIKYQSGDL